MGRSKKTATNNADDKAWCYFCDREFDEEAILVQHQLTKHFRCPECKPGSSHGDRGKCTTLHGLICHTMRVHNRELKVVPNSKEGRDDPHANMQVYGSRHVPEEAILERRRLYGQPTEEEPPPPLPEQSWGQSEPRIPAFTEPLPFGIVDAPFQMPPLSRDAESDAGPGMPGMPGQSKDWQSEVQEWMARKKREEEEERRQEEARRPPPIPEPQPPPVRKPDGFSAPIDRNDSGSFPTPAPLMTQGFQVRPSFPSVQPSVQQFGFQMSQGDSAPTTSAPMPLPPLPGLFLPGQANFRPPELAVQAQPQPAPSAPPDDGDRWKRDSGAQETRRSRGRGDEDDGRGRYRARSPRRSRSREASHRQVSSSYQQRDAPSSRAPPMESRTIQITGGVVATRLWLKKEMERFGRVEVCHTGNRQNPIGEPPWVRFATLTQAESAMEAINSGQVLIDGCTIKAEFKTGNRPPPQRPVEVKMTRRNERDMDITSRDIAQQLRAGGGARRRKSSSSSSSSSRNKRPARRR